MKKKVKKSSKHLNDTLPFEVLKIIFQYVINTWSGKKNLRTCLYVCKAWQIAAEEFFREMSITVSEDYFESLSKDVVSFAHKVKTIILVGNNLKRATRKGDNYTGASLFWFNIILACSNLVEIEIQTAHTPYYVRRSMDIIKKEDARKRCVDVIDFVHFFERCPKLKKISFNTLFKIKNDSKTTSKNLCLESLRLTAVMMDVYSLIFFTTCFKNLKCLDIRIQFSIADLSQEGIVSQDEFNSEKLLDDLKDYTSGIPKFYVSYVHKNTRYILKNGQKPNIIPHLLHYF